MSKRSKLSLAAVSVAGLAVFVYSQLGTNDPVQAKPLPPAAVTETAVFAGGCFWCMEPPFEKLRGVVAAESGYTGGHVENPTYEQVSHTETGHVEAVRITYDATKISYDDLLEVFWRQVDPTDDGGQFVDRGTSYLSGIFVKDDVQRRAAELSKQKLMDSGRFKKEIVTPIRDAETFYLAEDYHQDFYKQSKLKYKYYRYRSGRDAFIDKAWGSERDYKPKPSLADAAFVKPPVDELAKALTPLQFRVTQEDATEPPFKNEYWDNTDDGVYVDIVSNEPLFSSKDKFKSGTGWPSFSKPLVAGNVVEQTDYKMLWPRTEVRSAQADSHLGHVFKDGPEPTGLRYCMNSASLRFVPAAELKQHGLEEFAGLFGDEN